MGINFDLGALLVSNTAHALSGKAYRQSPTCTTSFPILLSVLFNRSCSLAAIRKCNSHAGCKYYRECRLFFYSSPHHKLSLQSNATTNSSETCVSSSGFEISPLTVEFTGQNQFDQDFVAVDSLGGYVWGPTYAKVLSTTTSAINHACM